ncbi:MAG: acyl-CoA dehydrogenase family protein, partial [Hyphomonadaceae bacterium]
MNFTLSEDNEALRDSAQAFLSKEVDLTPLKRPDATVEQAGYDRLWPKIVELGWPSVVIPEAYGGLGMTYLDLAMIIGEMGRTLAPSPLFGTLAGAWAIEKGGSQEQKQRLLGAVVAGEMKLALAFADESGTEKLGVGVLASKGGADWRLSGVRSFVVDALAADKIVVAAQVDGATRFFVVDRFAPGVTVELLPWRDITRQVCKVTLRDAASELLAESGA